VPARGRDFDALIDTGFTGFAQMPQASAVDIGLAPTGTMDLTFSDGH
jgi:predicted aspartyl protease